MELTTTTLEALDAVTLDSWNNSDTSGRINAFLARHAISDMEADLA